MSEIALYNLLKQIPNATDEQVEKAVESVASTKDVATKLDIAELKAGINTNIVKLETDVKYLRWIIVLGFGLTVAIIKYL